MVLHGPVPGADDRSWPGLRRRHAHRRRAHGRAARSRCRPAFAFGEPSYQAGVYRDVLLRRWRNLLGRTMGEFPGGRTGGNRYLVLGLGGGPATDRAVPLGRNELIAYGPLLSDNARRLAGYGGAGPGAEPGRGRCHLDPGPVRRHRSAQLAIRRAAVMIGGCQISLTPTIEDRLGGMKPCPHPPKDRKATGPGSRAGISRSGQSVALHRHPPPDRPRRGPGTGAAASSATWSPAAALVCRARNAECFVCGSASLRLCRVLLLCRLCCLWMSGLS